VTPFIIRSQWTSANIAANISIEWPTLHVEYVVFDFGGRNGAIDLAKANLLISNLAFNDTHRKVIFQVASAYYRLLNAKGQREAAEVSLQNARTVEQDAQNRLANGLATKPDLLEATAARAQADYDLQAAVGSEDITRGDLATAMGLPPETELQVQGIDELATPTTIVDSIDQEIDRAFSQRPELMQQIARVRAANASIKQARSAYFPKLRFSGDGGLARAYGQQDLLRGSYAQGEAWDVGLQLKWTLSPHQTNLTRQPASRITTECAICLMWSPRRRHFPRLDRRISSHAPNCCCRLPTSPSVPAT
jgi:outer membrane protein